MLENQTPEFGGGVEAYKHSLVVGCRCGAEVRSTTSTTPGQTNINEREIYLQSSKGRIFDFPPAMKI